MYLNLMRSRKYKTQNCAVCPCDLENQEECANPKPKSKYLYAKRPKSEVDYHTRCADDYKTVPGNMGWLWNRAAPQLPYRPGWKPGKVKRSIAKILKENNPNFTPGVSKVYESKQPSCDCPEPVRKKCRPGKNNNMKINDLTILQNTTKQDIKTIITELTKDSQHKCPQSNMPPFNNEKHQLLSKACKLAFKDVFGDVQVNEAMFKKEQSKKGKAC